MNERSYSDIVYAMLYNANVLALVSDEARGQMAAYLQAEFAGKDRELKHLRGWKESFEPVVQAWSDRAGTKPVTDF